MIGKLRIMVMVFFAVHFYSGFSAGERLIIGENDYHYDLNPIQVKKNVEKHICSLAFENLVKWNSEKNKYVGNLAEEYRFDPRNNRWVNVTLENQVSFQDNTPLDPSSIKYTLSQIKTSRINPYRKFLGSQEPKLDPNFPQGIRIPLHRFEGDIVSSSRLSFPIIKNNSLRKGLDHLYRSDDIDCLTGTGPFKIVRDRKKNVLLKRFGNYWKKWQGNITEVLIKERDVQSKLLHSLMQISREGDFVDVLPDLAGNNIVGHDYLNDVKKAKSKARLPNGKIVVKSRYYIIPQPIFSFYYIGFNYRNPGRGDRRLFGHELFRPFIADVFDKKGFFDINIKPHGELLDMPYRIESQFLRAQIDRWGGKRSIEEWINRITSDRALGQLLSHKNETFYARYRKDFLRREKPVEFTFHYLHHDPIAERLAESFMETMRKVGIKISLQPVNTLLAWHHLLKKGNFDFIYSSYNYGELRDITGFFEKGSNDNVIGYSPSSNVRSKLNEIDKERDALKLDRLKEELAVALNNECPIIFLWSIRKATAIRVEVDSSSRENERNIFDNINGWRIQTIEWKR